MFDFDLSILLIVVSVCCMALGLTYNGMWVQNDGMKAIATELHTYLALSTMDLFMNPVSINPNTVDTDLDVAVFTGYAQQVYTTTPVPVNDLTSGGFSIYLPSNVFKCTTAPGAPVTIYGCYLRDAAGGLIAAANFQTPINIAAVDDSVPLQVTLNFTGGGVAMFANILG